MNRAVFLDRDNTLIINDGDLADPEQVKLMQGAASAIASLRGLGFKIVVVTNQGGVARGKFTEAQVEATNQRIADLVRQASGAKIDKFYFCPYHPQGTVGQYAREHPWRKPQPGMLLQAASDLDLDLSHSWMVGDQMRDVEAGLAAGARTILLRADAEELAPPRGDQLGSARIVADGSSPHCTARNLIEAVRLIAQARKPESAQELQELENKARKWDPAAVRAARQANPAAPAVAPAESPAQPAPAARPARIWVSPPAPAKPEPAAAVPPPPIPATAPPIHAPSRPVEEDQSASPHAPPDPPIQTTLRQILQELRNQRGYHTDFSFVRAMAILLQVIAGFCLLAALLMSGSDQPLFMRWMASGILVQLATITLLLFSR